MEDLKTHIGKRVKLLRKAKALSQEELAGRMSRSTFTVSQIERGLHLPKIDTLLDLADALDCEVEAFIQDDPKVSQVTNEKRKLLDHIVADLCQMDIQTLKVAHSTIAALASSSR